MTKKTKPHKPRVVRQKQGTYTRVKEDKTKYNRKRLNTEENEMQKLAQDYKEKLSMEELKERLEDEFIKDVDFHVSDSPTKGTVAVVYFYEDKHDG